ncbi:MAG: PBP1A family penicillin-binding protein [Gemmatimonadota bacterium]
MLARLKIVLAYLQLHRRRILIGLAAAFALTIFTTFVYSFSCGFRGCPSIAEIRAYVPSQGGRVLDRNGDLLGYLEPVRRITVPLERIPDHVREAFIAVEDRRFAQHEGVDWRGVGRALWRDVSTLGVREGASTLTMQVARSAFLDAGPSDRSIGRKLIELRLAPRIEKALTKDQILDLYLNLIYLGDATYGVEAASRHYFGKSVDRLSLSEAAMLAALPRAPSLYDPRTHADRAVSRRNLVLSLMTREGFITQAEAEKAAGQKLRVPRLGWTPDLAPSYAVEAVRGLVAAKVKGSSQYAEITVHTTFDVGAQRAAERAVRDRAAAIGRGVEGAMIALDPSTGDVLAMVGGVGPAKGSYNRVFLAHRQPGSAFKPFVYAAALESGLTPATLVDDEPIQIVDAGRVWRPENSGQYLGTITLRTALAHSANAATVRVSQHLGINKVVSMARRMGITSPLSSVPSLALGAAEVTPAELVTGYAPFANGGWKVEPTFVESIDVGGKTVYQVARKAPTRVLDSVTAYLVTSMLRSVVDEGTGYYVRNLGIYGPVAGKTGTTNNSADVWFVGYSPTILAGFWFGYDTPHSLGGGASGGRLAAPAWASFYRRGWEAHENGEGWPMPEGIVEEQIDAETGMLAGDYCPTTRTEYFREGTQPTEYCQTHDGWFDGSDDPIRIHVGKAVRGLIDLFRGRHHDEGDDEN